MRHIKQVVRRFTGNGAQLILKTFSKKIKIKRKYGKIKKFPQGSGKSV